MKFLARRLHALGELLVYYFLRELERGAELRPLLEEYAEIDPDFVKAFNGDRFQPVLFVTKGDASMIDYETVKGMAEMLGRPVTTLIALARKNDPFFLGEGRMQDAAWFAEIYQRFGFSSGTHLRRIHLFLVSQETPVLLPTASHTGTVRHAGHSF